LLISKREANGFVREDYCALTLVGVDVTKPSSGLIVARRQGKLRLLQMDLAKCGWIWC